MYKKMIFLLSYLFVSISYANLNFSPPAIEFNRNIYKGIFVDFLTAQYHIHVDVEKRIVSVFSYIDFKMPEIGYPIFDLVIDPKEVKINNIPVNQTLVTTADKATSFRVINKILEPGTYRLEVQHTLTNGVSFELSGPRIGFFMSDLSDRGFLERYLPSNFEYDQYYSKIHILFKGLKSQQDIFTNGQLQIISDNEFVIDFPSYFNSSSFYFHSVPIGTFDKKAFHFTGKNKVVPVLIYGNPKDVDLQKFQDTTVRVLAELDIDYGTWPHPHLVIYANKGTGGMEYKGATVTSFIALEHELFHSYFARSVMPVDANSGWIDEALASWRDKGYFRLNQPSVRSSNVAGHSVYSRTTDRNAYTLGRDFMAWMDFLLESSGGLKPVMRQLFVNYRHNFLTTQMFQKHLEQRLGYSLEAVFNKYLRDRKLPSNVENIENPYHVELSEQQLQDLL